VAGDGSCRKRKNGTIGLIIQPRLRISMGGIDFLTALRLNINAEKESFITRLREKPTIKRSSLKSGNLNESQTHRKMRI
jgi:hypothetical protein